MAFEIPKQIYSGSIKTVTIGKGDKAITLGGETSYPFYVFEGVMPNKPRIAMEVWDRDPGEEWAAPAYAAIKDVAKDPVAWAQKCVKEFGAEAIALILNSTDPNGDNASAEAAAATAKKVAAAIDVPFIVFGTSNVEKDAEVLPAVAEACGDKTHRHRPGPGQELQEDRRRGPGLWPHGHRQLPHRRQPGQTVEHPAGPIGGQRHQHPG